MMLLLLVCVSVLVSSPALADGAMWEMAENSVRQGQPITVYVEARKTPGRPAFKIETEFDASPFLAAQTLMTDMLSESDLPKGQTRRVLERSDGMAVVYTSIELPLMLADREVAIRIKHTSDDASGIHRIDWITANEVLPAADAKVVRLEGTHGFWEFRPGAVGKTTATYLSQAEMGGSIPVALGDRLMKGQAIDAVTRLRDHIRAAKRSHVSAGASALSGGSPALSGSSQAPAP